MCLPFFTVMCLCLSRPAGIPVKLPHVLMGLSLAVVHVSWKGEPLHGLLMNRRREKCAQPSHTLFDGEREWDKGFTHCYTSFVSAWLMLPLGFLSLPCSVLHKTDTSSKTLIFFFFLIFSPSVKLLPREPEPCAGGSQGAWRGRPSFGKLILFIFPLSCCFLKPAISEVRAGNERAERSGVPGEC